MIKHKTQKTKRGERLKQIALVLLCILTISLAVPVFLPATQALDEEFTLVQSDDPELVNRCYLPPSKFRALAGSKIYIQGGVQPVMSTTVQEVELGPSTVTTGDARDVTKATTTNTTTSADSSEIPSISTALPMSGDLIYGQILNEQGDPDGGVKVQITWSDDEGKNHSFTTTTLTIAEARLFGDSLFEGYYFFSTKRIGGGTEYTVTRLEKTNTETAPLVEQEQETLSAGEEITPQQRTEIKEPNVLFVALKEFINKYWWWVLIPLGIILFIFLWYWKLKAIVDTILLPMAPKAAQGARDLLKRKAKSFMQTEWTRIDIGITLREATAILLGNDDGFVLVEKRGVFAGVLTLSDVLAALAKDEPGAVKIADLIAEPRIIHPSTPFRDLTLIDERILPVMKGNKIQGYIRRRDSLQLLDEYYSTHPSVARKLSSIRQLLSVPTPLFAKDSIRDAVSVIVKEKMSIGVIASKSGTGYRVMGLVPERLLVEELINFKGTIHQMNVETAMKRARTAEVTLPSLEGVRLILESEYRALVVTENDVLQGVLSEHILVKELRGALDKII